MFVCNMQSAGYLLCFSERTMIKPVTASSTYARVQSHQRIITAALKYCQSTYYDIRVFDGLLTLRVPVLITLRAVPLCVYN